MREWKDLNQDDKLKFTTLLPNELDLDLINGYDSNILDLGCGYGRTLEYFYNKGFKNLTGVDVSQCLINKAKENCPSAKYIVKDMEEIYLNEKFDLVLLMAVIEYIKTDNDQKKFFEKVYHLLNNNGYVFLETFTIDFRLNWKNYLHGFITTGHFGRFVNSADIHCHHQSISFLIGMVSRHFEIVKCEKNSFITWSNNLCNGYTLILKKR